MIDPVAGWSFSVGHDHIAMLAPDDATGLLRYEERRRPLQALADVIAGLPWPCGARVVSVSAPEPRVTGEGEYAAVAEVVAELDGRPLHRTVGAVFLDDSYALVVGQTQDPARVARTAALVRQLVDGDRHHLGTRRRRFVYRPPAGWSGFVRGELHATWISPEDPAILAVHPAIPAVPGRDEALAYRDRLLADPRLALAGAPDDAPPISLLARGGLSGRWWRVPLAGDMVCDLGFLEDGRMVYPIVLTAPAAASHRAEAILRGVLDSVEALPRPGDSVAVERHGALSFWAA